LYCLNGRPVTWPTSLSMEKNSQKMTAANRMLIDKTLRLQLQQFLLNWFQENGRDLPWRRTYQPYHIWISEIMLQQTQMERAVTYFERWMKRFPDIASVAAASEEEVLRLWEGLGYYSRARNIHRTAGVIAKKYNGQLPADHQFLLKLPGIGEYTAGAIMSLAFNEKYPVVDANVERLFARLFNIDGPVKESANRTLIWQLARELTPGHAPRNFNQALMELGALVCRPKNPDCGQCPLNTLCESMQIGIVAERPFTPPGKRIIRIEMATGVLQHKGKFFIQKRPVKGVWANLWEFPGGRIEPHETPEAAVAREFYEETELSINLLHKIGVVKHSYTRYRVRLHCYACRLQNSKSDPCLHAAQEYRWATGTALDEFAFPAPHRRLIEIIRSAGSL
jgi:A/G-specific adenine glycosylase